MNNSFKINKPRQHFIVQSTYQRTASGGTIRQNTYGALQGVSKLDNTIRFPSHTTYAEQMMPQYNNPGPSSSHYGYPFFQELPSYSEHQTYTPFAMKAHSSLTEKENANHFQSEDEILDKECHYKRLKPSPSTSLPKSGHHVRFSVQTAEITKEANDVSHSISTDKGYFKSPKRRSDDSRALRVLTGSIEKAIKWEKMKDISALLFEVIASLVVVRPGGHRFEHMLILRDEATPAMQCVFYAIDRPLPPLEKGQLVRCVGELVTKNRLKAYSVRAATAAEKSALQRLSFASQRAVTALQMATPEP